MKVLIVEDERRLAKALQHILTEAGYEAAAVYTGDDGLHYASAYAYDLIVLDVMLPGMDGFSVVKALRQRQNRVPVLMLTAKSSVADKVNGLDAGVLVLDRRRDRLHERHQRPANGTAPEGNSPQRRTAAHDTPQRGSAHHGASQRNAVFCRAL